MAVAVSLEKGGNVALVKQEAGVQLLTLAVGFDAQTKDGCPYIVQAACFLLNQSGKINNEADFVFVHNPTSKDGAVQYTGLNGRGTNFGDRESFAIALDKIDPEIKKIAVTLTILDAAQNHQHFGLLDDVYARVISQQTGNELVRYDFAEKNVLFTAMTLAELYRKDNIWKFKAVGQGFKDGLKPLVESLGIYV